MAPNADTTPGELTSVPVVTTTRLSVENSTLTAITYGAKKELNATYMLLSQTNGAVTTLNVTLNRTLL